MTKGDREEPVVVHLPRLAGSRAAAAMLVAEAGDLRGRDVVIDPRQLRSGPGSFIEVLLESIASQSPRSIEVNPAHRSFSEWWVERNPGAPSIANPFWAASTNFREGDL